MARDLFIPNQEPEAAAFSKTTHLGIGAHQDDLEFMAFHGILECFRSPDKWFGGVICTDGSGSSRSGAFAEVSDEELKTIRHREQKAAAVIGGYSFIAQLGYASREVRNEPGSPVVRDLVEIFSKSRPQVVYTHNPADRHTTHLRVLLAALSALRELPANERPQRLLGCEMWRGLDWMEEEHKLLLDVSGHEHLAAALNGLFDSQIAGGKRYDLAVLGRRRANATLSDSHSGDNLSEVSLAMDLTSLMGADTTDIVDFTLSHVDRFRESVRGQWEKLLRGE